MEGKDEVLNDKTVSLNTQEREFGKPGQENSSSDDEVKELKAKLKVMTTKF